MLTLEQAIEHCHEKAKELSDKAYAEYGKTMTEEQAYKCNECAREHEQLAAWLTELAEMREADRWIPVSERSPNTLGVYNVTRKIIEGETSYVISDACYFDGQNTWHADTGVNHGYVLTAKDLRKEMRND